MFVFKIFISLWYSWVVFNGLWLKYYESDPDPNREENKWIAEGTDYYGFSALPGGRTFWESSSDENYIGEGIYAHFWSSSPLREDKAYPFSIGQGPNLGGGNSISNTRTWYRSTGMSVRCIKDEVE